MKAIKINTKMMEELLPNNIKDSDVLSTDAKKVLTVILAYFNAKPIVMESDYLACPNVTLRESAGIKANNLLPAIDELIFCNLITRTAGEPKNGYGKGIASIYRIMWDNLFKPVVKENPLERILRLHGKAAETSMGTVTITTTSTSSNTITSPAIITSPAASAITDSFDTTISSTNITDSTAQDTIPSDKLSSTELYQAARLGIITVEKNWLTQEEYQSVLNEIDRSNEANSARWKEVPFEIK